MQCLGKKITVIVPIYNAELYISKCIESILTQTYSDLQIILIDDGSTDQSGKICDGYAEQDRRIEVYHTENKGLVAARKLGISHSTGEYIGFVDADDYVEPNMFEVLLRNICESGADFVHTGFIEEINGESKYILTGRDGVFDLQSPEAREEFLVNCVLQPTHDRFISYSIWSKLYKSELIKRSYCLLQDDWSYGEDVYSLCMCILQSRRISVSRCSLYHHVIYSGSMSHPQTVEHVIKEMEINTNVAKIILNYSVPLYNRLKEYICYFMENRVLNVIERANEKINIPRFYFQSVNDLRGKKVIIYGAGVVGQSYYAQLCKYKEIDIVAWLDTNWGKYHFDYIDVVGIDKMCDYMFDKIIIAVEDELVAQEIKCLLLECGQSKDKIVWERPISVLGNIGSKDKGDPN